MNQPDYGEHVPPPKPARQEKPKAPPTKGSAWGAVAVLTALVLLVPLGIWLVRGALGLW
jgi:hypothetical protein